MKWIDGDAIAAASASGTGPEMDEQMRVDTDALADFAVEKGFRFIALGREQEASTVSVIAGAWAQGFMSGVAAADARRPQ